MKSHISLLALLSLAMPVASQASFSLPMMQTDTPSEESPEPNISHPEKCTDFSGTWKGDCTFTDANAKDDPKGKVHEQVTHIRQVDCRGMSDGRNFIRFGTVFTYADPMMFSASAFDWNADYTALNYSTAGLATQTKSQGPNTAPKITGHKALAYEGTMKIENGALVMTVAGSDFKAECKLAKQ